MPIYVGNTNVPFTRQMRRDDTAAIINVATAEVIRFAFERPDGTTFEEDGSLLTNGSDGKVRCVLADAMNLKGRWKGQVFVRLPGNQWHAQHFEFDVLEPLLSPPPE